MSPDEMLSRRQLEEIWRRRLEESSARYKAASLEYHTLLQQEPSDRPAALDSPLAHARRAESDAIAEYTYRLRAFTDLTIHGKIPGETEAPGKSSAPRGNRIAVVDDDESSRDSTKALLRSAGYFVITFAAAEQFLNSGVADEMDCLILDVLMPGMDGLELQRRLNSSGGAPPIIFVTAHNDAHTRRRALDGGALDFLAKPFEAQALMTAVQTAIGRRSANPRRA